MSRFLAASSLTALALLAPQIATAAPAVEKGWPRVAPGSSDVVSDVKGGALFSGFHNVQDESSLATLAFTGRGKTRWISDRVPACGNCDGGTDPSPQPNGTFGPFGFTGDDFWGLTASGEVVDGCSAVTLPDGTCISHEPGLDGNLVVATRDGKKVWQYVEPDFSFVSITDAPEPIARDSAGVVYVGYPKGTDGAGNDSPARLLALNPDGTLKWRKLNPTTRDFGWGRVLAALKSGVVIETPTGISALGAGGKTLWSMKVRRGALAGVRVDLRRNRLFVLSRVRTGVRIDAVNARLGRTLWKTTAASLADIGRGGTLYVADRLKNGSGAVRAIRTNGKLKWRFRTASHVTDAAELSNRRVALSTSDGLALSVNPRRRARAIARSNVALTPRVIRTQCTAPGFAGPPCATNARWGAVLRMNLARASKLTLRFVKANGRPDTLVIAAPRGRSFHRLFVGDTSIRKGTSTVVATWREGGRTEVRRMPVSVR